MKKFIVLYHAPAETLAKMAAPTPEEMKKGMEPWMAWASKCGDKLVDLGTPLMGGQRLIPDGGSTASTRGVCGYSVLEANDMAEAKTLLKGHPHLGWAPDCEIEIHESTPIPGA